MWEILALWMLAHEANDPHAQWYSEQRNLKGNSCCSNNDWTNPSDWRRTLKGYEVFMDGAWVEVPEHAELQSKDRSPTGQSVLWFTKRGKTFEIYCFVPGAEG